MPSPAPPQKRCPWCGEDPLYVAYHDHEWGFPVADDRRLFEKLCLEGFQSGLAWITILRKREAFREAFHAFDPERVARMGERDVQRLLGNPGIVRHRGKIESTINNAVRARELADERGSLAAYFWSFEPPRPARRSRAAGPAPANASTSPESVAIAKDLKRRGWTFVGPTTVYAFMQAMGLVNDHQRHCATHAKVDEARRRFVPPV